MYKIPNCRGKIKKVLIDKLEGKSGWNLHSCMKQFGTGRRVKKWARVLAKGDSGNNRTSGRRSREARGKGRQQEGERQQEPVRRLCTTSASECEASLLDQRAEEPTRRHLAAPPATRESHHHHQQLQPANQTTLPQASLAACNTNSPVCSYSGTHTHTNTLIHTYIRSISSCSRDFASYTAWITLNHHYYPTHLTNALLKKVRNYFVTSPLKVIRLILWLPPNGHFFFFPTFFLCVYCQAIYVLTV